MSLTDEDLRDEWRRAAHPNTTEMMATILALRARVAKLEAELKGANLAADKLGKAYDAALSMQTTDAKSTYQPHDSPASNRQAIDK